MPSEKDIKAQQELLTAHRQTLVELLKQRAWLSELMTPPGITHGIRETRDHIRHIKSTLRMWGVNIEDFPDDEEEASPQPEPVKSESFRSAISTKSQVSGGSIKVLASIVALCVVVIMGL